MELLKDKDIRNFIINKTNNKKRKPDLIIHELGLSQGEVIADLAIIDSKITGIEIKSDADSLMRLSKQIEFYNKNFDRNIIYISSKHLDKAIELIPSWWGVYEVSYKTNRIKSKLIQSAKSNPYQEPRELIRLLWKDEALKLLERKNLKEKYQYKNKDTIWDSIVENFSFREIKKFVLSTLKSRENWKSA